ncbi:MAG: hypothetical protein HUU46_02770 [Candidatus Hydrogenedentes bacterium]|nr:hypothetical protein [Candidatus Hydrogenedentota bacterium]
MKSRVARQVVLCVLAVGLMGVLLVGGVIHAQGAKFSQPERVRLAMDNSPEVVIAALEAILTQEQITAFETVLLPKPSDAEKQSALDDAKRKLMLAGFAADDPVIVAISSRVDEITVDAAPAVEPAAKE